MNTPYLANTTAYPFSLEVDRSEGIYIIDKNGRSRHFDDIENWLGKRGQAGKKVPKGFPRNF